MKKVLKHLQGISILLFLPFGLLGAVTITENIFEGNLVSLAIGAILVFTSAVMFTFTLLVNNFTEI